MLSVALEKAVRWKIISQNVCALVDPPRIDKPDLMALTVEQVFTLLGQARGHRLEVLLLMAIITGMRRGELLALRWSDIDFELGRLVVLRTVSYIATYGYVEGEPKTKSGKRAIELPGFLLAVLKDYQVEQAARREGVEQWEERGLVFPNQKGGYLHPVHMGEVFRKMLADAGLPAIRFHDLRHSAASILIKANTNSKVIQELMGHSNILVTMDLYGHLFPTLQTGVANTWDDVFKGKGAEEEDEGGEGR